MKARRREDGRGRDGQISEAFAQKTAEDKKGGNSARSDGLIGEIVQFLETKGVEVYRMEVGSEAYQVRHNGQIIRFYVQGNNEARG